MQEDRGYPQGTAWSAPVHELLRRLAAAVATAVGAGLRVDEINKPNSDVSTELPPSIAAVNAASK